MDFSKQGIRKERDLLDASAPRLGNRFGVTVLRVVLFLLIAAIVILICMGVGAYQGIIADAPDITDANIMPLGYASFVYDQDGEQIQKLSSVEGNRISVDLKDIPINMQHAIVAIEDSRFYEHNGVDPHGMIRAVLRAFSSNFSESEGASTITQQLLKNNVFKGWMSESRFQRISRKIQEQYLAVQLEKTLREAGQDPKAVILENYLNTVNFGSGAYGVQTAAQTYFGKNAKDLTLSECAVLAAIPQNPSLYNPKIYPEKNAVRMKTVLEYMLNQGYITKDDYNKAIKDDVYDRISDHETTAATDTETYSYFVDELIASVKNDLMSQKGYTEAQANDAIYNGGLKIYSTENASIQKIMEEEFTDESNFPAGTEVNLDWALTVDKADGTRQNYSREMLQTFYQTNLDPDFDLYFGSEEEAQGYVDDYKSHILESGDKIIAERTAFIPEPQAAMTVIDQSTGYVVGIVGGRGEKTGSLTLDRATDAYRQPQSTLRILSTYGPAIETGAVTLATQEDDKPNQIPGQTEEDDPSEQHYGTMTVRQAISSSNNTIALIVLEAVTPNVGYEYLTRLGFSNLNERTDASTNLATGSTAEGVTNLQLTAAYAAIANGGTYNRPVFYSKVTDQYGNIILENKALPRQVFKSSTAYLLTSAMQDVVSSGTGTAFQLNPGISVAGKTGTTDSDVDLQFVGFTPYYTAGIWTGYDTNVEMSPENQTYISTLWTKVMNRIHENLAAKDFTVPDTVEQLTVCAETGLLAGSGCPTVTDYFDIAEAPTTVCTEHVPTPTPVPRVTAPAATPVPAATTATTAADNQESTQTANNGAANSGADNNGSNSNNSGAGTADAENSEASGTAP